MALPDKICMLPWISIETSPIGTARPCCLAVDEITKPNGTKYNLKENTLQEIYQSPYMQDLRQQFLNDDKPETCRRCWDEEAAGRTSKRMHSIEKLKSLGIDVTDHEGRNLGKSKAAAQKAVNQTANRTILLNCLPARD